MQRKQNYFGVRYGNRKKHNRKEEWIDNKEKELQGLDEGLDADIHTLVLAQSNAEKSTNL